MKRIRVFGLVFLLIATVVPGPGVQAGHLQDACDEVLEPAICEPVGDVEELCDEILPELCAPWTEQAKLTASDPFALGASAALDGDTALIGSPFADVGGNTGQGAAYVYERVGAVWIEQARITAVDGAAGDRFGVSVALDGDTAVIGSQWATVNDNNGQGAAYVYERVGTDWIERAKLTASDGAAGDNFGGWWSVAVDGDTALIGAYAGDNNGQGAAYVYEHDGTDWREEARITASDGAASDNFGGSVALDGGTALIGANQADVDGNTNQGAAYVYERSGTSWIEQAKLTALDGAARDYFGLVALDGDTALIGARLADVGGNTMQGAAYVYERVGGVWFEQAKLTALDGAAHDGFGRVTLDGDTAFIGAPGADVEGNTGQGAAYVYGRVGAVWIEQVKIAASDGAADDNFGVSVALDGDTALIGAPTNRYPGAAYVYHNQLGFL